MINVERVKQELHRIREAAKSPDLSPAQRREMFAAQQALAWVLEWNHGDVMPPVEYVLMAEDESPIEESAEVN